MTKQEFDTFSWEQKIARLKLNSTFIQSRIEDNCLVSIYQFMGLMVEIWYSSVNGRVEKIICLE